MSTVAPAGRWNPIKDLDNWWFGKGSPVTLGLFRVVMGIIAFASLALTLIDFDSWYTEHGFVPLRVVQDWSKVPAQFDMGPITVHLPVQSLPRINLLGYVFDSRITLAFYLITMLAALGTALGIWTRLSTITLAVGVISLHHRNPLILHSGDTLMRLCLVYLAWAPSGAACSMDRIIRQWKGQIGPETQMISLWGQRLVQYQTALVYFTTVWWKWFGTYWKDGTATWYPENLNEFNRFPVPNLMRHQPFIAFSTYATVVVELSLATLVFYRPLRKYVIAAGILMHSYIEYRYNIPFFAFSIIATYLCFFDGEEVADWARKVGERLRRFRLLVELPLGTRLRPGPAVALASMDPAKLVTFDPGTETRWQAVSLSGKNKPHFFGTWVRMMGAWPLGVIPGLWPRLLKCAVETLPHEDSSMHPNGTKGSDARGSTALRD